MTVFNLWLDPQKHRSHFFGLDTDVKPVSSRGLVPYVSKFFATEVETDCTTEYLWTGTDWVIQGFTPAEVDILRLFATFTPAEIDILRLFASFTPDEIEVLKLIARQGPPEDIP